MGFIAGAYTATYVAGSGSAESIGRTRVGFDIEDNVLLQAVHTDDFGDVEVDGVCQGVMTTVRLDYVEYDKILAALNVPFGTTQGVSNAKVGTLNSLLAGALVLTPVAGTPAASITPNVYTFPLAIVSERVVRKLSSKLREGPLTFRAYPNLCTGVAYTVD
jgi:hypothetical protein